MAGRSSRSPLSTLLGLPRDLLGWAVDRFPRVALALYPPYLGTGIVVDDIAPDYSRMVVRMPLTPYNRNYVGTHFGGSLYAMCDPFYMLMLIKRLGPEYVVWDKRAAIRFRRPGRGTVRAVFVLSDERVEVIRDEVARSRKIEVELTVDVVDEAGEVIAQVDKVMSVRAKEPR